VVSFTSRPLYPQGKSPWYSLDRKLGSGVVLDAEKGKTPHTKCDNHALNVLSMLHVTEHLYQLSVEISYWVQNYITFTFLNLFYNETYGCILRAFIILRLL
jgi:hypothetical protein